MQLVVEADIVYASDASGTSYTVEEGTMMEGKSTTENTRFFKRKETFTLKESKESST